MSGARYCDITAFGGSTMNISGGIIGSFEAEDGSEVNISGGTFGRFFQAFSGSVVHISGGTRAVFFQAFDGSEVNLIGSDFRLDGVPVVGLSLGQALEITNRNVTLSGLLTDGTAFSFELNSVNNFPDDFFDVGATVTVSLEVPFLLGDVNQDGSFNFLDIAPFILVLQTRGFVDEADIDRDGDVDFLDIDDFINLLAS